MEAWSFGLNENEEVMVTYFAYTSIAAKECVMMCGRVLFSDTTEEEEEEEEEEEKEEEEELQHLCRTKAPKLPV